MKKHFKKYAVIWAIALAVFNAVVFITPNESEKYSKFGGAFWAGYVLITLAFIGQLAVSFIFFKEENKEKTFLNLSMFSWSLSAILVSLIAGAALMVIPDVPQWAGAIVAFVVLGFYTVAIICAKGAAEAVYDLGRKVEENTAFIKNLTVEAESLISKAKTDDAKAVATKVFEEVRYSNKSSHGGLKDIENKISAGFTMFAAAVESGSDEAVEETGEKLITLVEERDKLAKSINK